MNYRSKKTPIIKDEKENLVAIRFLEQIHHERGLIHHLENEAGINGMLLKVQKRSLDLRESKVFKILLHKARLQCHDDFMADWDDLGELIIKLSYEL